MIVKLWEIPLIVFIGGVSIVTLLVSLLLDWAWMAWLGSLGIITAGVIWWMGEAGY